jgi:haloalkane dehalogenase
MPRTYAGLNVESDFQGQFPWRSRRIDVGGGVHQTVVDEGPRTAPVTFVLLHGNPTWGFLYRKFVAPLARDYRVVIPDHVGFGRSDKPRDPAYYTLERHIANLTITLEQLNVARAVLVMQDWGGPIGMGWATRHADRVAGFVVLNTWAFVEQPPLKLPWLFKFLVLGKGGWKRATQNNFFTEMFLIRGSRLDAATAAAYRAAHPTPDDRIGIARFPQLIRKPRIRRTRADARWPRSRARCRASPIDRRS